MLCAFLIGMFLITSGWGTNQTTKAPVKVPGQYFRAPLWSGHLSITSPFTSTGIIIAGLVIGIFGTCWRSPR